MIENLLKELLELFSSFFRKLSFKFYRYLITFKIDLCEQVFLWKSRDNVSTILIDQFLVEPLEIAESTIQHIN
jgi:hypothetical protein